MSQPIFYYPVTVVQGGSNISANAPLLPTLPLDSTSLAAILGQDAGAQPQGLYVDDGEQWRFALPYIPLCAAGVFANSVTIYADPVSSATAPAGSTVYKNGILQSGLAITPGNAIYVVLTPSASGGGYVLPPANNTTLGGVIVASGSNISVDVQGRIDIQPALINTINAKLSSVVTSGTGTSVINSVASGTATLKSVRATNALVLTDSGTGTLTFDVPIATTSVLGAVKAGSGLAVAGDGTLSVTGSGPTTLTGDVTGSGTGSIATSLSTTGVTAGTYTKVTVDTKGRVSAGAQLASSDVTTALGYTPYNGSTNPNGFLTTNQSITVSGDASGTGSTAITLTLANSGVTAGTYHSVTVDAKGRVTVGANLAGSDVTTALGYTPVNKAGDTMNGALNWASTVSLVAASTTDLGGAASNSVTVTGNTAITALGTAPAGAERWVTFTGTPTLTYNASSLILPTSADIVVAAGDSAVFLSLGGGNWRCVGYARADGTALTSTPSADPTKLPLAGGTLSGALNLAPPVSLASASTVAIGAAGANDINITGNVTITAFDTIASGAHRSLIFGGALTLTHNGTSLILPGAANITTAAGDVAHFVSLGSGNWRCVSYMKANGHPVANSLSGLTLVNPTITNFTESGSAPAAGSAFTVDLSQGTDFEFTTNANTTITLPAPVAGKSYTVCVIYGGVHTVTFAGGGTIKYSAGTPPTPTSTSGARDYYLCKCDRTGTFTSIFDGGRNF